MKELGLCTHIELMDELLRRAKDARATALLLFEDEEGGLAMRAAGTISSLSAAMSYFIQQVENGEGVCYLEEAGPKMN